MPYQRSACTGIETARFGGSRSTVKNIEQIPQEAESEYSRFVQFFND